MLLVSYFLLSLVIFLFPALFLFILRGRRGGNTKHKQRYPPGPPGWPIVGNLLDVGTMPHRTLTNMRGKYGDVIWLRMGAMKTMAILSAKASTEFFKNHDLWFAERTITETMRAHGYDQGSLALAPYGPHWRVLRKLVTMEMLVNKRILETAPIRRKCVDDMLLWIEEESHKVGAGVGVRVARFVFLMTFNLLGNLMLSRDLFDPDAKEGSEFFDAMMGLMEWSGHANLADIFPCLRWLDPQGLKRKMERDMGKALGIASKFVKERLEENRDVAGDNNNNNNGRKDFLDVLLQFEGDGKDEPAKISDHDVNIFIL
ncbi:hypothetical protein Tsubulata_028282, partial [Turnera subulata]